MPRWVRVALFGPYLLLIVWALTEAIGSAPSWLFWAVIASIVLGSGSVVIVCLYHVSAARVSRILASRRKPNA